MIMQLGQGTIKQAHKVTAHTDTDEIARQLGDLLSPQLTALIAGVDSPRTVTRWATCEVTRISPEKEARLRNTHTIVQLLTQYDTPKVVRAWFVGMNPILDDSPARAIRDGRFQEALKAAQEFILDG
jgi:hypothetical protein